MTAEANLPPELSLTDLELSIVIGNLLDNAIEGCGARLAKNSSAFLCG